MTDISKSQTQPDVFPVGGGEMGARIRQFDWSRTPLGPLSQWPASLRTATGLLLLSPVPIVMLWGEDGVMLYNDAYSVFAGARHPTILGSKVREGWPEVADFNDHVMKVGLGGGTLSYKDQELTLHRTGAPEQVWMNLDYSPVPGDDGKPAGVIAFVVETTERVLAEQRTRDEQIRQRRMLAQMPGFVAVLTGPQHTFDYINDAYAAISGRSDFVGRTVPQVFPDLAGQGFYELLDRVYATGEGVVSRGMQVRFHGAEEPQYIDFVYEPIRNDDGEVSGIFVGGYEVTEAHRANDALRKSEAQLRELNASLEQQVAQRMRELSRTWEVSPEILGVANKDGYFETSNPAWQTLLGWPEQDIRTTAFIDFVHPDDQAATREGWERLRLGEPVLRFENRYRTQSGDYRWLSWVAVPEGDKVYCSARDVTAEKAQAQALAQSNLERDRIWRNAQDVITVIDAKGVVQSVNPAARERLGWSAEDMVGRPVLEFIHPEDHPPLKEDGTFIEDRYREPRVFPNRFRHKDGSYRWMAWFSAIYDGLIYSSGRDVTVEREQAEALKAVEEELRQSQKMEAVGQLTGGIAHDFNNLLAGISGSLELLERRLAQGRLGGVERYIAAAQGASRRAAALTQRLLAFSRRQTLDPKPTDLNRLIGGMEDLIRRSVGPNVTLEVVGAGGLWLTKIDPSQLENALLNLCINARDAMAPHGGRVTIETANKWLDEHYARERDMIPGQYVSLCVTDTGTGMTPEVEARAFDPFFTTKPMGEGTGLGLSMVYGFVRQSGGQVRIYSELGQGTTMCLYLPRHLGEGEAAVDIHSDRTSVNPSEGEGETVLVIDDEPTVRMVVVEVLQDHGYTAIEAADGPSGLRILQSDARIDLLITDVGLPGGLNGRQIADAARIERPDLKVLFITGYAENAAVGNGLLDQGMAVITKPFVTSALGVRIREMIDG